MEIKVDNYAKFIYILSKTKETFLDKLAEFKLDKNATDKDGNNAFYYVFDYIGIDTLVRFGLDINLKNNLGNTALMQSMISKPKYPQEIFTRFIDSGADLNIINLEGETGMSIANSLNRYSYSPYLIYDPNIPGAPLKPIALRIFNNNRNFYNDRDNFYRGCIENNLDIIRELIANGINVNFKQDRKKEKGELKRLC
jgi:ankyrin repeat protein